jgi:hypothetical protein
MKLTLIILLTLIQLTSFGQKRDQLKKSRKVKIDTVAVFDKVNDDQFKEINTFWSDKNELGLNHRLCFDDKSAWDDEYCYEFSVTFKQWDKIEKGVTYDLEKLMTSTEFENKRTGIFGTKTYDKVTGQVKLIDKSENKIRLWFDLIISDKEEYLIYTGEREFKRDY